MTSGRAARVAALARAVGVPGWADDAARIAGDSPAPAAELPTYAALTRAAVDLVLSLADAGRWQEARVQAEHLAVYLTDPRGPLDPMGVHSVGAFAAAARGREAEALHDFGELLVEVLGGESA